jgi:hypothetical protein
MRVSVADAKNKLPELIKAAESGEPVTICRRELPVSTGFQPRSAVDKSRGSKH